MGRDEWAGLAVPLFVWLVMFTLLGVITYLENRPSPRRPR